MKKWLLFCLLCGISIHIRAQARPDTLSSDSLRELVVSDKRMPGRAGASSEAIGILGKKQILNNQLRTTPEALAAMPGLFVQKTNHGGGSPFLRGLTGNQVLLLVDGIRLNNSTFRYGPNQYLNTIGIFSVAHIEALRGSGSVQYGSDALGGVVHVFTESPRPGNNDWGGEVTARGASDNMELSGHGRLNYSGKKTAFTAGYGRRSFGDLVGGDTTGVQSPSGYDEQTYDVKGLVKTGQNSELILASQATFQEDVDVYHKVKLENFLFNRMTAQQRALHYARFNKTINKGVVSQISLTASLQKNTEWRESLKNNSTVRRDERDSIRTLGFTGEVITRFSGNWKASSGIEWYHDLVNSSRSIVLADGSQQALRGLYPDGSRMSALALYSVHQADWRRWQLTAGGRVNTFAIQIEDSALGKVRQNATALVGNTALQYRMNQATRLIASLNSGFRAPNIDDLGTLGIVDFRFETPNYDLRPERSLQGQLGLKWEQKQFITEVFVYRNRLSNLISRVRLDTQTMQGYPLYTKVNSGKAYIQGVESAFRWNAYRNLSLSGSFTWTRGDNISASEPMRRIPPAFGWLKLSYLPTLNTSVSVEWLAAGQQDRLAQGDKDDNRIPAGGTPGWNVLNLHAGWTWKRISVNLSALNLTNEDYRTHGSGINGVGRSLWATLRYKF
ncbi:MAG: TonB-dependent receptor plug domain-containing protein [Bacteroidota bacterium]